MALALVTVLLIRQHRKNEDSVKTQSIIKQSKLYTWNNKRAL